MAMKSAWLKSIYFFLYLRLPRIDFHWSSSRRVGGSVTTLKLSPAGIAVN